MFLLRPTSQLIGQWHLLMKETALWWGADNAIDLALVGQGSSTRLPLTNNVPSLMPLSLSAWLPYEIGVNNNNT